MNIFDRLHGRKVFLSYRRSDSAEAAGRIYNALATELGKRHIFQDVNDIPLGADFQRVIAGAIRACAVQLIVIGPHWLDAVNEHGQRRLLDPNDIVRLEIETALKHNLHIIPLLVDGATMPARLSLPVSLQALTDLNGQVIRSGAAFEEDMRRIARAIKAPASPINPTSTEPLVPPQRSPFAFVGQGDRLKSIAWSPDGSRIVSASWNGAYVWEAREGTPTLLHYAHGKDGYVDIVAWSPDGTRIATASTKDNTVHIWTAATGKTQHILKVNDKVGWLGNGSTVAMCWSPDGQYIAAAMGGPVKVWSGETGQVVTVYHGHKGTNRLGGVAYGDVHSMCWSPDGKFISSQSYAINLWEPLTGQPYSSGGPRQYQHLGFHALSSDGLHMAAIQYLESEKRWLLAIEDLRTGKMLANYPAAGTWIRWLGWSPDNTRIATVQREADNLPDNVYVWDAHDGAALYKFDGHARPVSTAAWSPEGGRVASGGEDNAVWVWPAPQVPHQ